MSPVPPPLMMLDREGISGTRGQEGGVLLTARDSLMSPVPP